MSNKIEERSKYERVYGATCPLPYGTDGKCSVRVKTAYGGCSIESEKITFSFTNSSIFDDEFSSDSKTSFFC